MKILKIVYSIVTISLYVISIIPVSGSEPHVLTSYIGVIIGLPLSIPVQICLENFTSLDLSSYSLSIILNLIYLIIGHLFWFKITPMLMLVIKRKTTHKD